MRLNENYIKVIKKGGDMNLYLIVENKIKRELGEQKIDIVFNIYENRLIEKAAKQWRIKL